MSGLLSRVKAAQAKLKQSKPLYYAYIFTVFVGGILLLVLPAQLITYEPQEKPELNLQLTFAELSVQGWLALGLTLIAFLMMVTDSVG